MGVLGIDPEPGDLERAEQAAAVVGRVLSENGGKIDPEWSVEIGIMARVILYEENRQQLIDHWEHMQRMKQSGSGRK